MELVDRGIVSAGGGGLPPPWRQPPAQQASQQQQQQQPGSSPLLAAAAECDGLSGRALRRLPFLALAGLAGGADLLEPGARPVDLTAFLAALRAAASAERDDRAAFGAGA